MDEITTKTVTMDKPTTKDYVEAIVILIFICGIVGKALHLF